MAAGFLAGLWTASRRARALGFSSDLIFDVSTWILVGTVVGARTLYVGTYWEQEFSGKPWTQIFNLRQGGLVFYGGLVGAAAAVIVYARRKQLPLWTLADILAPSIALGHAFGRGGCLMTGCCYGKPTELPWGIHFPADHWTRGIGVHPTQIYEAALNLMLYGFLAWRFKHRRFDGQVFAFYLVCYAAVRTTVEVFRGDYSQALILGPFKPGQLVSLLILACGIGLWWCRRGKTVTVSPAAATHE